VAQDLVVRDGHGREHQREARGREHGGRGGGCVLRPHKATAPRAGWTALSVASFFLLGSGAIEACARAGGMKELLEMT
jgi:hypothetical protein